MFLLLTMFFFHIVDDYYLQGWLASAKQKSWWETNAPSELYKNDYKMALIEHAFSWTFVIHLPIMAFIMQSGISTGKEILFAITFTINWIIHAFVDNLKANKLKINLVQDQIIHFIQIILTWILWKIN